MHAHLSDAYFNRLWCNLKLMNKALLLTKQFSWFFFFSVVSTFGPFLKHSFREIKLSHPW